MEVKKLWVLAAILLLVLSLMAAPAVAQQEYEQIEVEIASDGIVITKVVPIGTGLLWITNSDTAEHNVRVLGPGVDRQFLSPIQPGQTKTLRIEFQEGTYTISTLDGGGQSGMTAEFEVARDGQADEDGDQQATGQGEQQDHTAAPTGDQQSGQTTPTNGSGQQGGQPTQTPTTAQNGQQTATPDDDETSEVPVTGPEQGPGFSVRQVALPGQSGSLDFEIQLVKVADGLIDPVSVAAPPDDSGRLFVVERNGVIRVVADGQLVDEPFLDLSDMVLSAFLEQGMYDLAFHPDFADNGLFYVHFAEVLRNGDGLIVEYRVSEDNPNAANPDSARLVLHIEQPFANHNGGEIAFGPDGYLYIGSGDGGWEGDPLEAGQDLSTLLGKVLRIDVNPIGTRPYTIPADNPFAADQQLVELFNIPEEEFAQIHTQARPEIWAYGLRNPWKFHFDPQTGDLYLPDVGQNHWEEINFQPAGSQGGENYGWDLLMGTHCFPIEAENCEPFGVLPVAEYSHDLGLSITGLGVYRGDAYSDLDGVYFVGDWGSGRVWGLRQGENEEWTFAELLDTDLQITSGDVGPEGDIYVTSCNCNYGGPLPVENPPGSLWRIVPADQVPEGAETAPLGGDEGQQDDAQDQQDDQQDGEATSTPTPGAQQTATPQNGEDQGQATPTPGAQQTQTPQDDEAPPAPTSDQSGGGAGGEELVDQGQEVYTDGCARCHGTNGEGQVGPALAGSQFVTQEDAVPVIDVVLHGRGAMPPFESQLSDEQVAAVLSFIRSTWGNNAPVVSPEDVSAVGDQ